MQQCEGFRSDVTSINLSMMTYEWFQHKRHLYTRVEFPGLYHAAPMSDNVRKRKAFTPKHFIDLNYGKQRVFLGGKLSFDDPELTKRYTLVPVGLSSEFKLSSQIGNDTSYMKLNTYTWKVDIQQFVELTFKFTFTVIAESC